MNSTVRTIQNSELISEAIVSVLLKNDKIKSLLEKFNLMIDITYLIVVPAVINECIHLIFLRKKYFNNLENVFSFIYYLIFYISLSFMNQIENAQAEGRRPSDVINKFSINTYI